MADPDQFALEPAYANKWVLRVHGVHGSGRCALAPPCMRTGRWAGECVR